MAAYLSNSWPAWLALVVALALGIALKRRPLRLRLEAWVLAAMGLGGLLLHDRPVTLGDDPTDLALVVTLAAAAGLVLAVAVLLVARVWSFALAVTLSGLLFLGLGGVTLVPAGAGLVEAARSVAGLQFVRPEWLLTLLIVPVIPWISRRSLSGLGPTRKWAAVSLRTLGVAMLALALAEPRLRRPTDSTTVIYVVDRSFSIPQELESDRPESATTDRRWARVKQFIEQSVKRRPPDRADDASGLILFGKRPKLALTPTQAPSWPVDERLAGALDGNYTDINAALKLALASFPEGAGKRIVLISDGSENLGVAEETARLAAQNQVQIDTIALAPGYKNQSDVLVTRVEVPAVTALGQQQPVRVSVDNATPNTIVEGRLELVKVADGEPTAVQIEDGPQVVELADPPKVRLIPGLNVFKFRTKVTGDPASEQEVQAVLKATFTPTASRPITGGDAVVGLPGDRLANNRAEAITIGRGRREVLLIDEDGPGGRSSHDYLLANLRYEPNPAGGAPLPKLKVRRERPDQLPQDKKDLAIFLSGFDALILGNVPYERFTEDQAEAIRASVYDQGMGLVMLGGPDSFGAGGYQGTRIEEALPVDCEIKALKAAGRGGLVLVMHASEMADGNKWQKDIAKLAVKRLGPADMVGVVQYDGFGGMGQGVKWHIPFQTAGESGSAARDRILAAVDSMSPGDMPDFDPFLVAAYDTLSDPKYQLAVKHCILISDGDPNYSGPGQRAVANMAADGITCTTIGVATHGGAEKSKLKLIAEGTVNGKGEKGNFYDVTDPNQLPSIYIKESRRVSQSFLMQDAFAPIRTGGAGAAEVLAPGLPRQLPNLYGMVRTTLKDNVLVAMPLKGPSPYPDQEFPLLASWRYGLGKAVAFTSDARTQPDAGIQYWDREWAASAVYRKFWEQTITWAMREAERGRLTLVSEYRDGKVRVTADVRDDAGNPVSGIGLRAEITRPTPPAPGDRIPPVEFRPKGNGQFEAEFEATEAGGYFLNVLGRTPDGERFDSARVGVSVPYSPEYSDLETNPPLLERIARLTGGNYHTDADDLLALADSGEVYREALSATRAVLPFWFWLVFAASIALLFDVAVRRIAIERQEFAADSARLWRKLRTGTLDERTTGDANLDRLLGRKRQVGAALDESTARRRFTPGTAPADLPAPAGADEFAARTPARPTPPPPPAQSTTPAEDADDPLTRLRKARDRARDQQRRDDTR